MEGGTGRMGDQKQCEQKHRDLTVHGNPRKGKHQKCCTWVYLYRMLQRILGAQNRESVMSGPEVTIAASNVRVSRHIEQKYLSSSGEDISL